MKMDPDNDLPLLSNTQDIQVTHYVLDLRCDLDSSVLAGSATYFLDPYKNQDHNKRRVFGIHEFHKKYSKRSPQRDAELYEPNKASRAESNCNGQGVPVCTQDSQLETVIEGDDICREQSYSSQICQENVLVNKQTTKQQEFFHVILDCCDLDIEKVEYSNISNNLRDALSYSNQKPLEEKRDLLTTCLSQTWEPLQFSVEKWCLRIWKEDVYKTTDFPPVIKVMYRTTAKGTSLRWTLDQDGK